MSQFAFFAHRNDYDILINAILESTGYEIIGNICYDEPVEIAILW
jgi:hypothetical protein